jgi:hypothetical protein
MLDYKTLSDKNVNEKLNAKDIGKSGRVPI